MGEESKKKSALVPRLRFPEFRNAEGWTGEKLGSKTKKVGSGITPTGGEKNYKQSGRPFVRSQNIGWGELLLDDVAFIDEETHSSFSSTQIDVSDVLLNITGASIGRSAVADARIEGGNVNQHVCIIRVKPDELSPYFLNQYLISHDGQKQIDSFQAGGNRQGLNFEQIRSFLIPLPAVFIEQQKIADCLSSLDNLITAETQKLNAIKAHKKGLMQQLFPREGETVPRLRFPEFRDAGKWNNAILGGLSEVVRGGSPRPIDGFITMAADGLNWLKIGDVDKEAKYVTRTAEKVRPEALNKTRVVKPGDLILSNSMSFGRPYILQIETCIHDGWIAITDITKKADRDFIFYSIATPNSQSYFVNNAAGSGVQNLNADIIKALPVSFPSEAEQQRIANCLSSLDDLITTHSQKIDALKTHKQGLMQQLFPVLDEAQA